MVTKAITATTIGIIHNPNGAKNAPIALTAFKAAALIKSNKPAIFVPAATAIEFNALIPLLTIIIAEPAISRPVASSSNPRERKYYASKPQPTPSIVKPLVRA